jgi:hypothetical protein
MSFFDEKGNGLLIFSVIPFTGASKSFPVREIMHLPARVFSETIACCYFI